MLYHSMTTISMFTAGVTLLFIWFGSGKNPFVAGYSFIRELITSRTFLILFLVMVGVLLMNSYELKWEAHLTNLTDFTPLFHQIEGDFVKNFQQFFHWRPITEITAFFYIIVLQALLIASMGIYAADKNRTYVHAVCYTVIINYVIAIPFYLFFPIHEVWSYAPAGVSFYMHEVFPGFDTIYRPLSGIDNCFPSLHTSISVSMAILAVRSGNKRWAACAVLSATIIVFAIFYMGIHWLIDMSGGLVLAVVATSLAIRLAERSTPRLRAPHAVGSSL
ncbi:membrane-associated phospholipid phosphatase [Paenibacillus shirakamiensis]|uniref:Membrane-associated phospholipid phosphatase n=1 Tax=Paenibacillus shirakamiensis TaxID=1265935 RepID=A0ABS4JD50_9BACL|nr:phosphatase PAP2 family protein [Paenibacillus shirakamiensis]MBP1999000.1 membrane-associated phospholipid phosphatase [Paenibacillus shirakamiensis]